MPFTSMTSLCLSSTTGFPYEEAPAKLTLQTRPPFLFEIEHQNEGTQRYPTPAEAVQALADAIGSSPAARHGTADD